jgi:ribosomal protein L7/L12
MSESLLLGLAVAGLAVVAMIVHSTSGGAQSRALSRMEAKLDALLKHEGIQYDPYADLPASVLDALRRGRKIEAIKEYRQASGAGLKEAKEHIEELQRRAAPRA